MGFSVGDWEFTRKTPLMTWAFIITVIATVCLSGIPPFTAYWVKAAMDYVVHELTHEAIAIGAAITGLLLATSITYAAFLAKFLSLNFIKGEKPHHVYAHGGYGARPYFLEFTHCGIHESTAILVGLLCLLSYAVALYKPRIMALAKVGEVLSDRLYLPIFCDVVMASIGWGFAKGFWGVCRGIDWWAHNGMVRLFQWFSNLIRAIQTGYLSRYIGIVLGILVTVILIFVITYASAGISW